MHSLNKKGFTLIEIVIAFSISALSVSAVYALMIYQKKEQEKLNYEITDLFIDNTMKGVFKSKVSCEKNILNKILSLKTVSLAQELELNSLKGERGEVLFTKNGFYTGLTLEGKSQIKAMSVKLAEDLLSSYPQTIEARFFYKVKLGIKELEKTLRFYVVIDSSRKVLSCNNLETHVYGKGCSGANEALKGFDSQGQPICQILQVSPTSNPTLYTCPHHPNDIKSCLEKKSVCVKRSIDKSQWALGTCTQTAVRCVKRCPSNLPKLKHPNVSCDGGKHSKTICQYYVLYL